MNNKKQTSVSVIVPRKDIRTNQPKFSVLMANYNKSKYVAEAIQSVLDQTFKDWELVIVDDCSTDDSIEVIIPYLKDKRIRLLKNSVNKGIVPTQKRLINEAQGEILGVLDSDDVLTDDALEVICDAYKKNPDCGFIYSQFMYCDADLKPTNIGFCKPIPPNKTNLHCDCVTAFRTFKKEYYLKTEGYNEGILYAEDKDLVFKIEEVTKLLFVDKILYKYRELHHSQTHNPQKMNIVSISICLVMYNAYKRRLNTNIPNLTRKEMSDQLFRLAFLYGVQKELKNAKFFLLNAIKLDPLNFGGLKTYIRSWLNFTVIIIYEKVKSTLNKIINR